MGTHFNAPLNVMHSFVVKRLGEQIWRKSAILFFQQVLTISSEIRYEQVAKNTTLKVCSLS